MLVKGTSSSKSVLLEYLTLALKRNFTDVLFLKEEPLPDFPVFLEYLCRIIIILEGEREITGVYDKEIETKLITPGNIIYTAKNSWAVSNDTLHNIKSLSIVVMPDYLRFVAAEYHNQKLIFNPYYHTKYPPPEILLSLANALNILRTKNNYREQACLLLKAFVLETIDELKGDQAVNMGKAERSFKLIKEYIDHNYHLPIDLNQVCDELSFNPSYVSRMFKEYGKENIKSYMEKRRMAAAREILGNVRLKISQVAKQCGYSSEAYFIKVFKKIHDMTPGEFRDRNLL